MDLATIISIVLAVTAVLTTFAAFYVLYQNDAFKKKDKSDLFCEKHKERTNLIEHDLNNQKMEIELLKSEKANNVDVVKIFERLDNVILLIKELKEQKK